MIKLFSWSKEVHKGKKVGVSKTFTFAREKPSDEESEEDEGSQQQK